MQEYLDHVWCAATYRTKSDTQIYRWGTHMDFNKQIVLCESHFAVTAICSSNIVAWMQECRKCNGHHVLYLCKHLVTMQKSSKFMSAINQWLLKWFFRRTISSAYNLRLDIVECVVQINDKWQLLYLRHSCIHTMPCGIQIIDKLPQTKIISD